MEPEIYSDVILEMVWPLIRGSLNDWICVPIARWLEIEFQLGADYRDLQASAKEKEGKEEDFSIHE